MMDDAFCNVIYVDSKARHDRCVTGATESSDWECPHLAENIQLLLAVFSQIHVCCTGGACLTQWLDFQDTSVVDGKPTLILIDTPISDRLSNRSPSRSTSPCSRHSEDDQDHLEELYGLALLQRIVSESSLRDLSKFVVAVPIISGHGLGLANGPDGAAQDEQSAVDEAMLPAHNGSVQRAIRRNLLKRCLDLGATDVMSSPMSGKCINSLEVHAYRARRDVVCGQKAAMEARRARKRSWVGISDEKPYAYLREKMVSTLMSRICRLDHVEGAAEEAIANPKISLPPEKQAEVAAAIGGWQFCAHDFSDDDLVVAATFMFRHALSLPELEPWRITTDQLHSFLIACRAAYNDFVPYHNFRHVIDVLQVTFIFLVQIGSLPPYPQSCGLASSQPPASSSSSSSSSPISSLVTPFEALTLLITAIGHDVGHPGVNNGFLVTLNAPLAQVYNDRSVLESFHCAAYSQILRRYWPAAFNHTKMRSLMISSILSTDMQLHFDYMEKMGSLQSKLEESNTTEGWSASMVDEQKNLACALLIKCADISNVARKHPTAKQWMHVLSDEFSRQRVMEKELEISSSIFGPPAKDYSDLIKSQIGFMDTYAIPLFQGVAGLIPALQYCVDELNANRKLFDQSMRDEQAKTDPVSRLLQRDGSFSPRMPSLIGSQEPARLSATGSSDDRSVTEKGFHMDSIDRVGKPSSEFAGDHRATFQEHLDEAFSKFDRGGNLDDGDMFDISEDNNTNCRGPTKQRCSETTEGSSAPNSGDWASQATSATTSKLPLSPSTQGTSIISRDSLERLSGIPNAKPPGPSESLPALAPITAITTGATSTMTSELEKGEPAIRVHLGVDTHSFRLNSARSQPNLYKPSNHVHTQFSDKPNSEGEDIVAGAGYGTVGSLEVGTEGNRSVRKMSSWLRQKAQFFRKTTKTPSPRIARSTEHDDTGRAR